jgi:hypothetical protein
MLKTLIGKLKTVPGVWKTVVSMLKTLPPVHQHQKPMLRGIWGGVRISDSA